MTIYFQCVLLSYNVVRSVRKEGSLWDLFGTSSTLDMDESRPYIGCAKFLERTSQYESVTRV